MKPRILHVGCGPRNNRLPSEYAIFHEERLDADPACEADIVASIVAMPMVDSDVYDAIFASHVLEHLFAHEAALALAEFYRVLKPGGIVDIRVPDLQSIGSKLALDKLGEGLYQNGVFGLVEPLDMIYGHRASVANGNHHMAHRTGFTASVLKRALGYAGFKDVTIDTLSMKHELRAMATKKANAEVVGAKSVEECTMIAEGCPNDDAA